MTYHVQCPDCGGPMTLRPSQFRGGQYYACNRWPSCRGAHGAHHDGSPKGFPGNAKTRAARIRAHDAFDRLWKTGGMSRHEAYAWMRQVMGMTRKQAHIAKMTADQCEALITLLAARESGAGR